jgi:hypothetical protein
MGGLCNKLVQDNIGTCAEDINIQDGCCSKNCSAALATMLRDGCLADVTLAACNNNATYGLLSSQLTNTMRRCLPATSISSCSGLVKASDNGKLVEITKDLSSAAETLLAGGGNSSSKAAAATGSSNGAAGRAAGGVLALLAAAAAAVLAL